MSRSPGAGHDALYDCEVSIRACPSCLDRDWVLVADCLCAWVRIAVKRFRTAPTVARPAHPEQDLPYMPQGGEVGGQVAVDDEYVGVVPAPKTPLRPVDPDRRSGAAGGSEERGHGAGYLAKLDLASA